ncbi:MAG: PQQ-binding-like beta-propeller repeat protein [Myxococcota bacterium]|nr:PQQ-binding-like beta-propeller repeat protein [Myxococcota bacterium]MDW8361508.1 PQQ-binding-like beta-propeller repeat protein [Myxococcales bacterium]
MRAPWVHQAPPTRAAFAARSVRDRGFTPEPAPRSHRSTLVWGLLVALATSPAAADREQAQAGSHVTLHWGIDAAHPWPCEGGNAARTGRGTGRVPEEPPRIRSEVLMGGGRSAPPIIDRHGRVWLVSSAGVRVFAPDGSERLTAAVDPVLATPSLLPDGRVLVATRGGDLLAFGPHQPPTSLRSLHPSLTVRLVQPDGSLVIIADDGLIRIDSASGWPSRPVLGPAGPYRPAGSPDGRRLVWIDGHSLVVHDTERGTSRRIALSGPIMAGPVLAAGGEVLAITADGLLYRVSRSGRIVSRVEVSNAAGRLDWILALGTDGCARVRLHDAPLACVERDGSLRWRLELEAQLTSISLDARDTALAIDETGALVAVDGSGVLRWRAPPEPHRRAPRPEVAPLADADGTVYTVAPGGWLQRWR